MKETELLVEELSDALLQLPEVIGFFKARDEINQNEYLQKVLRLKIFHQKKLLKNKNNVLKRDYHQRLYDKYAHAYDQSPLVKNYLYLRDIVYDLLMQIKTIIE